MTGLVLAAHGSRDPRAARATRALAAAVAAARPGTPVCATFLDHTPPRPAQALWTLQRAGRRGAVLVPLLMTAAYHGRVDIPAALAAARRDGLWLPVAVADVLGPVSGRVHPALLSGLRRRLSELEADFDAVVLAAAGTRDEAARHTVAQAAAALQTLLGVPVEPGYASAAAPTAAQAVTRLRSGGARRVAVAAYFLAPGRLYRVAADSARAAGAVAVAGPLTDAPELATLVLDRAEAAAATIPLPSGPAPLHSRRHPGSSKDLSAEQGLVAAG